MPKVKLLRFTVRRYLLILTAAGCAICFYVQRATEQAAARQWVNSVGGKVIYDHEINCSKLNEQVVIGNGWAETPWKYKFVRPAVGPQFLRNILGVDYFSTVVGVNVQDTDSPVEDFSQLMSFRNLQLVEIELFGSNDCDFSTLSSLPEVRRLEILSSSLEDLSFLESWDKLQALQLRSSRIKDIKSISHLKCLERLYIESEINSTAPIANLTALKSVDIRAADFDIADFTSLKYLEELFLAIPESHKSDSEFEELARNLPTTAITIVSGKNYWESEFRGLDLSAK